MGDVATHPHSDGHEERAERPRRGDDKDEDEGSPGWSHVSNR